MLRILKKDKDGNLKATTLKEQEKLCKEDPNQTVGEPVDFHKPDVRAVPIETVVHPGLRQPKVAKKVVKDKVEVKEKK